MNPIGARMSAAGSRNGRSRSGSWRRSAARASGAIAYASTVAETMKPTSFCQPGKGRKRTIPITKLTAMLKSGTPRSESHEKIDGM